MPCPFSLRTTLPAIAVAILLGVGTPGPAAADDDGDAGKRCKRVSGTFSSMPAATCESPVGLCTEGELKGRLAGDYAFTMAQILPTHEPSIPTVSFFTGTSVIETRKGTLVGTDAGSIDLNPFGSGKFVTLITFTAGAGKLSGARGYLQLRGTLDFSTGGATGKYRGELCLP